MDKRILILIVCSIVLSSGLLVYKKLIAGNKSTLVSYMIEPVLIDAGNTITYKDKTEGATRWKWEFGDGEYAYDQAGSHNYLAEGKYKVRLTVYGKFGLLKDSTKIITVIPATVKLPENKAEQQPDIIAGPLTAHVGESINFESGTSAAAYEWTVLHEPAYKMQRDQVATYIFHSPGKRTILLRMQNPDITTQREINIVAGGGNIQKTPPPVKPRPTHHDRPAPSRKPSSLPSIGGPQETNK